MRFEAPAAVLFKRSEHVLLQSQIMHGADAGLLGRSITDVNDHRPSLGFSDGAARVLSPNSRQRHRQRPVPSRRDIFARGTEPRHAPATAWPHGRVVLLLLGSSSSSSSLGSGDPAGSLPRRGGGRARPVRWRGSQCRRDALRYGVRGGARGHRGARGRMRGGAARDAGRSWAETDGRPDGERKIYGRSNRRAEHRRQRPSAPQPLI